MNRKNRFAAILAALCLSANAWASGVGYTTRMGQANNPWGQRVPEIAITVHRNQPPIARERIQADLHQQFAQAGISVEPIELQSVATAAIQLAETQDPGLQTICYETWCARVKMAD